MCVCSCLWVCEERARKREKGKTGSIRFPWLARCWPQSYLDTLTFCFCLAVQSEHGGLFTHIYLCHATPGQVSAMQWLPLLSSTASVQHPWVHSDRLKCTHIQMPTCIHTHTNVRKHTHAGTHKHWIELDSCCTFTQQEGSFPQIPSPLSYLLSLTLPIPPPSLLCFSRLVIPRSIDRLGHAVCLPLIWI